MKTKTKVTFLLILLVIGLIIITFNKNKKYYTDIDGIKYAILVDGISVSSFPSGNYKVDIDCTSSDAYWNSATNKVIIKNIKGNVSCDISFNSITSSDYLNTYLINISGTTQGEGNLVQETGSVVSYSNTSVITNYGTTPVYFRNTSNTSATKTATDNYWIFDSLTGEFTSDPTKMTTSGSSAYYHVYAQVPSAGNYQICYTIAQSSNTSNRLYISKNNTSITNINSSTSAQVGETCYHLGLLERTDYINISELAYNGTSSPVMTFRLEKATNLPTNTGYRYEGPNPYNYVMFNDELWRVLGIFETEYDSNNDGIIDGTANLVKIIRGDSIGGLVWDKSNYNDWPNTSLYHLLNYEYYDWNTYKTSASTYCYGYSTIVPANCDYSVKGIKNGYRSMIVNSKWYLGGGGKGGYTLSTPDSKYGYERDSDSLYGNKSTSTMGYIGLMYESDYLYGVLANDCARTTESGSYSNNSCAGKNWLYGKDLEWTITPFGINNNLIHVLSAAGSTGSSNAGDNAVVRPTLYLSPDVYRVSGTGSITDPYIIGMAS